jgi:hypothetical protein
VSDVLETLVRDAGYLAVSEVDLSALHRRARRRRRHRNLLVVGCTVVVFSAVGLLGLRATDSSSEPTQRIETPAATHSSRTITYTAPVTKGFSVRYPSTWHLAKTPLTPDVTDGREIVSIGSYPLPAGANDCTHGPTKAIAALPTNGALISIQDRTDQMLFGPRPIFPAADDAAARYDQPAACVTGTAYEHWWFMFDEHQRSFQVLVAFGSQASQQTKTDAWNVLNSMYMNYPPTSSAPNHVSPDMYAAQADGAVVVIDHTQDANGYYATALRTTSTICVDIRRTSQASGPRICSIPADTGWANNIVATIIDVDGVHYLVGAATADVTSIFVSNTAPDPPLRIDLAQRLPFPTIQFFAQPIPTDHPSLEIRDRLKGPSRIDLAPTLG